MLEDYEDDDGFIKDDSDDDDSVDVQIEMLYTQHVEEQVAVLRASAQRSAGIPRPTTPHRSSPRSTPTPTPTRRSTFKAHKEDSGGSGEDDSDGRVVYVSTNPVLLGFSVDVPRPFSAGRIQSNNESLLASLSRELDWYSGISHDASAEQPLKTRPQSSVRNGTQQYKDTIPSHYESYENVEIPRPKSKPSSTHFRRKSQYNNYTSEQSLPSRPPSASRPHASSSRPPTSQSSSRPPSSQAPQLSSRSTRHASASSPPLRTGKSSPSPPLTQRPHSRTNPSPSQSRTRLSPIPPPL